MSNLRAIDVMWHDEAAFRLNELKETVASYWNRRSGQEWTDSEIIEMIAEE
jgi:hypothetical protein